MKIANVIIIYYFCNCLKNSLLYNIANFKVALNLDKNSAFQLKPLNYYQLKN